MTDEITKFDIRKKIIADTTYQGWRKIPHVSYIYEADATDFYKEFNQLNKSGRYETPISFNTLLLRVIVEGLKAAPKMNAEIKYNPFFVRGYVIVKNKININMPVLLSDGKMIIINLHDFGNKTLTSMAEEIEGVMQEIKESDIPCSLLRTGIKDTRKLLLRGNLIKAAGRGLGLIGQKKSRSAFSNNHILSDSFLNQGTVTVSNLGAAVRGTKGRIGLLDIVPPQVCVIGIGALQKQPGIIYKDDIPHIGIREILPVTIVFDHRALDFGEIAPFINCIDHIFKNPNVIHGW